MNNSDLLKRADLAQTNTKLVGELADRIRYLEAPTLHKRIAVGFFRWWWNTGGTNTSQGFDTYYEKLLTNELELPSEAGVEVELDTIPALEPYGHRNIDDPEYDERWQARYAEIARSASTGKSGAEMVDDLQPVPPETVPVITRSPAKPITLENLEKDWLSGTTCHRQKLTVHWVSDDGQWIVMKHHGHSEWVGGWDGTAYCGTRYDLFRVGDEFPRTIDQSPYFTQESRWSKASTEWVEKVMAGWRPDNFVETQ